MPVIGAGLAVLMLGILLRGALTSRAPIAIDRPERTPLGDGAELFEARLLRGEEPSGRIVALYLDPRRVSLSLLLNEAQAPLSELAPEALAVINAGFFTKERKPTGLLVSDGKIIAPFVPQAGGAGSGVFLVEDGRAALIERDQAHAVISKRSFGPRSFGIQAGPRIIEPGGKNGIIKDDGAHANRTVIGANEAGRVIIAVILGPTGWPSGPTLFEAQEVLGAEGLGKIASDLAFRIALNLDGGPSTGLHLRADHAVDAPEAAPVHSVIALRLTPP